MSPTKVLSPNILTTAFVTDVTNIAVRTTTIPTHWDMNFNIDFLNLLRGISDNRSNKINCNSNNIDSNSYV